MYMSEKTAWRFTVPQAGEVDSAESVEARMVEIDHALIGPMNKAELLSQGRKLNPKSFVDGDKSCYSEKPDDYWTKIVGRPIYTTTSHYHPMPSTVVKASQADKATTAEVADRAVTAQSLTPGIYLNGLKLTGENNQNVTLHVSDIPDAPRVFWGANEPSAASIRSPRSGDVYVRIL